jgi:hypothetical protein
VIGPARKLQFHSFAAKQSKWPLSLSANTENHPSCAAFPLNNLGSQNNGPERLAHYLAS